MIRSLLVLLALLIGIPVLVYYAMQSNAVQTAAVRWLMEQLGQTFGTTIQVGSIDISFFDRVPLEKVLVQDQKKDTLIFIDRLNVRIDSIRMGSKRVHLDEIMVEGAKVHLFQDTTGTNFQFILDSLGRSAPAVKNANTPWEIHFNNLFVRDAGIRFRKPFADTIQHKGIDFNDLDVSKINFSLVHMSHNAAGLTMLLDNASFVEKSGYSVKNLTFKALVDDSGIHASNFAMISPNSRIFCDSMQVVKRKGLIPDGIHPVRKLEDLPLAYQYAYEGDVSESVVSLADAAYFIPDIWGMEEPIIFSGKMRGTVDNLKFKELNFRIGQKTSFNADLELKGLPDWQNTYIFLKFYNNTFNFNDFAKIRLPESSVRPYPNIPKSMLDDVDLTYHGTFSGFPSDFVAYGKLDGELGSLSTDIAISPSLSGSMKFKGLLDAKSFKLGKFIGYDPLGEITLHSEVVLQKNGEKFDATIAGNIDSLYFRNTRIDSIYVNGKASNKSYDGQLTIRDKNLNLSFLGKADLESKTPVFNFSSKVKTANLNLLGLDNLHKEATCSFDMEANFTGKNIDELNGTIDVKKLKLARQDKTFSVNSLVLQTANSAEINTLTFRSDIADANVSGKYKLLEIDLTLRDYLQHYLPSSDLPFRKGTATGINVFNFDLNVKKPEMITFFYLPEMTPNSPIALKGEINSASKSLHLECTAGDLTFRNLKATDIRFTSKGDGKRWQSLLTMHNLAMGGSYQLDDLSLDNTLFNDTLQSTLGWGQAHEKDYTGKIITEGIFSKDKDGMRIADFTMKPSDVVIADTTWHFDKSTIHLDSTRMVLSGFNLHHGDEYLRINGQVSANPDDRLKIHLNKINLGFFDLISKQKIGIEGELSGSTELSNVPNSFFLNSALYIRNFHFEKNHYGDVSFENRWNQEDKRLYSTIMLNRNDTTSLFINGYYTPSTDSLHYRARFQDFHLESIFPFLTSFSNGVSGQANGIVNVTGTFDDPCFLGKVDLTNAKIGVDYTKVTYKFDHFIEFADDTIAFRKITLHDNENNTAILNGYITHKMFGKLKYNIGLKTNKIEVLKTSPADNSLFYGEAHAAGDLLITGAGEKVRLDANIVSQDGTQIYIPMETPAMASDNSFIRFVRKGEPVKPKEAEGEAPDNGS
ncbi:MAG: translocation/assembly module TamB, partial [Marinilabiliales bacterium]|nr:translocation/assembly module TamB [Marinilabiliales bacterium]